MSRFSLFGKTIAQGKRTVLFDLDETLFSRYFRTQHKHIVDGLAQPSHTAPCSKRQQYFWINQEAWQVVMPSILQLHNAVLFTSSICHDEKQIKHALNTGLLKHNEQVSFTDAAYFDGRNLANRHALKGERIINLVRQGVFDEANLKSMLLIDDHPDHLKSAKDIGIDTIQAGEEGYLHKLCKTLNLQVDLPCYTSYQLGWDSKNNHVTVEPNEKHTQTSFKLL